MESHSPRGAQAPRGGLPVCSKAFDNLDQGLPCLVAQGVVFRHIRSSTSIMATREGSEAKHAGPSP